MVSDDEETGTAANLKNARKKAAKWRAKENAAAAAAAAEVQEEEKKRVEQQLASAKAGTAAEGLTEEEKEKEKQVKAIRKKIRQVMDLKAKKDSGEPLNPDQLTKVTKILELTRQLEALGVKE